MGIAILELLESFIGGDPRSAESARDEFREGELFRFFGKFPSFQLSIRFLEESSRNQWLVLSRIKVAAVLRIFEDAVVKVVLDDEIDVPEGKMMVVFRPEVQIELEPMEYLHAAPSLMGELLEN